MKFGFDEIEMTVENVLNEIGYAQKIGDNHLNKKLNMYDNNLFRTLTSNYMMSVLDIVRVTYSVLKTASDRNPEKSKEGIQCSAIGAIGFVFAIINGDGSLDEILKLIFNNEIVEQIKNAKFQVLNNNVIPFNKKFDA